MHRYFVMMVRLVLLCLLASMVTGPFTLSPVSESWAESRPVVFAAFEYGFTGPDRIPAGLTTVQLVNKGKDLHHIQLVRLLEGKKADDFIAALKADPSRFPTWIAFVGGPNAVIPGGESVATMQLAAGEYLLICLIPDQKGLPHVAKGMAKPVAVTAGTISPVEEPAADLTITQADFRFGLSMPISAGTRTRSATRPSDKQSASRRPWRCSRSSASR